MPSYPTTPVAFPTRSDGTPFSASFINALQDEVTALEASLIATGILPSPITVGGTRPQVVLDNLTGTKTFVRAEPHYMIFGQNITKTPAGTPTQPNPAYGSTQVLLSDVPDQGLYLNGANAMADPPTITERLRVGNDGAIYERSRPVAMGDWITVPYTPAMLTAAAGTWTVTAPNWNYSYALVGKLMVVNIYMNGPTSSATGWLRVNMPAGFVLADNFYCMYAAVPTGQWAEGLVTVAPNAFTCYASAAAGAWGAVAGAIVSLQLSFWVN